MTRFFLPAGMFGTALSRILRHKESSLDSHSASPIFMLPYNPNPENSILLSGAIDRHYPLRQQMRALCEQGSYSIAYHQHPGYYTGYDYESNQYIGAAYARGLIANGLHLRIASSIDMWSPNTLRFRPQARCCLPTTPHGGYCRNSVHRELALPFRVSKEEPGRESQYVLDKRNHEELDEIRRKRTSTGLGETQD